MIARLSLLIALFGMFAGALRAEVSVGETAPAFTLKDASGKEVSLSDFAGKFVVLEWSNPSCPFVVKFYEPGAMQKLQAQAAEMGAVWLTVNSTHPSSGDYQKPEEAAAWAKEAGVKSTWLLDPEGTVGKAYGARNTPHMFVISPEGKVIYNGAIDSIRSSKSSDIEKADNYVMAALQQAKAGEAVKTPSTRPYGCSVKYGS